MKKFILFMCTLSPAISNCQMRYIGADGISHNLEIHDVAGRPIPLNDHSNIDGTPFLQNTWTFGIIILKNGGRFSDSSINYSLYNDNLFVKRNDIVYSINSPIREFFIEDSEHLNENKIYHFKNGFPEINKNDSLTFYEVLLDGNSIKLLKRVYKKVEEIYIYSGPFTSRYSLVNDFFVFFPKENKMINLGDKINLKELTKKLPDYYNRIGEYNSVHKLNWKKNNDLIQLFYFLDSAN